MVYYGLGLNVGNLYGDIYINFAINASMEVAAYILCLLVLERVGRKPLHAGTMIIGGACLCTIFTVIYADECKHENVYMGIKFCTKTAVHDQSLKYINKE